MSLIDAIINVASLAAAPHATEPLNELDITDEKQQKEIARAVIENALEHLLKTGWNLTPPGT